MVESLLAVMICGLVDTCPVRQLQVVLAMSDLDHSIGGASGELLIAGLERDAPAHDITDITVDDTPP